MPLLSKVLDEHFLNLVSAGVRVIEVEGLAYGSHCDNEGCVVRTLYDILIQLDNLLDSSNYRNMLVCHSK